MKRKILIFSALLGAILLGMAGVSISVSSFNHAERSITITDGMSEEEWDRLDCQISIAPRGTSADQWIKNVKETDQNGETILTPYVGLTYDIILKNMTPYSIHDWTLKIPVSESCYLNNAWCGQMEVHQSGDNYEISQTIDLRKYIEEKTEIVLNHRIEDADLMISLNPDDYFIYHPSIEVKEDVIFESDASKDDFVTKRIGMIIYYLQENGANLENGIEFKECTLNYHLHKNMTDVKFFSVLCVMLLLWVIFACSNVIIEIHLVRLKKKQKKDAAIIEQSMMTFMNFIDAKDTTTRGHSKRVGIYSKKLAKKAGLSEDECEDIYYIGLMHDCGKIGIPEAILNKPDRLTTQEIEIMKNHTLIGDKILENFTSIDKIRDGALYHHERYDGKGYPKGLQGENIPLPARIICIADSFDVMNSDRCYHKKLDKQSIMKELRNNKGTQFDPALVELFLEMLQQEGNALWQIDEK